MQAKPLTFVKFFLIVVVVSVFGIYIYHQTKVFLAGPQITVYYPANGQALNTSLVTIRGLTKNSSSFFINGRQVFTDSYGNFEKNLLLARGYNIIELLAEDRRGRKAGKQLELVLE